MIAQQGNDLSASFAKQLDVNGIEAYCYNEDSGMMTKAKYESNAWSFTPLSFNIERAKAYWVKVPNEMTVSLLGEVQMKDKQFDKKFLADKFLTLGMPFPATAGLSNAKLAAIKGNELYLFHNDTKLYEKLKGVESENTVYWENSAPGKPEFAFYPASGYWYRNFGNEFMWNIEGF